MKLTALFMILALCLLQAGAHYNDYSPYLPPFDLEDGPWWPEYPPPGYDPAAGPFCIPGNLNLYESLWYIELVMSKIMETATGDNYIQHTQEVHFYTAIEIDRHTSIIAKKTAWRMKENDFVSFNMLKKIYRQSDVNRRLAFLPVLSEVRTLLIGFLPQKPDLLQHIREINLIQAGNTSLSPDYTGISTDLTGLAGDLEKHMNIISDSLTRLWLDEGDRLMYVWRIAYCSRVNSLYQYLLCNPGHS